MKRNTSKIVVCVLMAAILAASMLFVLASADTSSEGMSFAVDSYYDQKQTISPQSNITYEAEIWFSATDAASTAPGIIASNYTSSSTMFALTLDVQKGGKVRIHTQHNDGSITDSSGKKKGSSSVTFGTVIGEDYVGTDESPKYVKIAVTVDSTTGEASLYLNGEFKESKTNSYWIGYDFSKQDVPLRIGGDYRSGNAKYFQGKIKNIALYQNIRSAEQIAADAAKGTFSVDASDVNLVYAYDLTDTSVAGLLKDLSANGNDAINPALYVDEIREPGFHMPREDDTTSNYPSATYDIDKRLTEIPETLEAWVYVPQSVYASRIGVIFGNYSGYNKDSHLNFELAAGGVPRLQWYGELNNDTTKIGQYDIRFSNSVIPADTWTHLAFVYDNENGVTYCYINGELSESKYFYPIIPESAIDCEYVLGGDNRNLNSQYFKGELGDITVYSDVRTADEIKADFTKGIAMTKAELDAESCLLYYDLDASDMGKGIVDDSGNGYDAFCSDTWLTENDMAEMRESYGFDISYSFAIIGDTQYTTRKYPEKLPNIYKWIVNNKDAKNIKYVMGMGDITDANGKGSNASYDNYVFVDDSSDELAGGYYVIDKSASGTEWDVAYHAITILDGNLEYSIIRGNHDKLSGGNGFNEYFAGHSVYTDQFVEQGGIYGYNGSGEITDVANTWRTFQVGEVNYLFMNLDYGAKDPILAWAAEIIDRPEYKDYKVIVTTHGYLYSDGTTLDPGDYGCPTGQDSENNNGIDIWNEFISKHANIQLVLCGHFYYNNITNNQLKGDNGNTVTEILIDAQAIDNTLKGLGIIGMFYFSEDGTKLAVEFYSTERGEYYKTANQLVFDLEAEGRVRDEENGWHGAAIAPTGKGTESDPYVINNAGNLLWMADQIKVSTTATFVGKYFEQTSDIDLNGLSIKSIGYMFESKTSMAAFGGIYNGNGYSIKNGTVEIYDRTHAFTCDYGHGLFGVIYGATVKNVVLDNVQILGAGVTGGIVGIAMSPKESNVAYEGFNVISGCELKSNVRIITMRSTGTYTAPGFDDTYRAGRLGSVCGMAYGTVIDGCTSDVSFTFTGDYGIAGGIAGTVGVNTTISNCRYGGIMTLYDNAATQTSAYGGIVGAISPSTKWGTDYSGYVHIVNCYNEGNFEVGEIIKTAGAFAKNTHWAGILGCAAWITYSEPTEDRPYQFLIESCYNLSAGPERIATGNKQVISGIVAKCLTTTSCSTLFVKDCYSVTVTNAGGDSGTNECRWQGTTLSKDGYTASYALENVATKTAEELKSFAEGIDSAISSVKKNGTEVAWHFGLGFPQIPASDVADKYYDASSNVYYVSDGTEWVPQFDTADVVVTPYGIIPTEYVNATEYPVAVFCDGVFVGAYAEYGVAMAAAVAYDLNGNFFILLRENAVQETKSSLGNMKGSVTLDLNGHTLTKGSSGYLFDVYEYNNSDVSGDFETKATFRIINGSIVKAGGNALVCINYGDKLVKSYYTYFTFENVTFSCTNGANAIFVTWEDGYSNIPDNVTANAECIFKNCTFDYENSITGFTMFTLTRDGKDKTVFNITVEGGKIIADRTLSITDLVNLDGNTNGRADSFVFTKDASGNYTTLELTNGAEPLADSFNNGTLVFVKSGEADGVEIYKLIGKALADVVFTPMASITLDRDLILNVYVPVTDALTALEFAGSTVDLASLELTTVNGASYYVIRTPLAASSAAGELSMKATLTAEGISATKSYAFGVIRYAEIVLAGDNDAEKTLVKNVLSYVRAAYAYFGTEDATAIAQIDAILGEGYDESNKHTEEGSAESVTTGLAGATLVLDATPAIRFYLAEGADASAYEFFIGGNKVKTTSGTDTTGAYIEIDVYAYAMCETVSYTVNGEAGGSYHIASYYAYATEKGDAKLIALVDRMWKYFQSARDYRASVIG